MSCIETASCEEGDHTYSWPCDLALSEPAVAGLTAPTAEVHGLGIYADADMWKAIREAFPLEAFRHGHWVKVHALGDAEHADPDPG